MAGFDNKWPVYAAYRRVKTPAEDLLCAEPEKVEYRYIDDKNIRESLFRDLLEVKTDKQAIDWVHQYGTLGTETGYVLPQVQQKQCIDSLLAGADTVRWLYKFRCLLERSHSDMRSYHALKKMLIIEDTRIASAQQLCGTAPTGNQTQAVNLFDVTFPKDWNFFGFNRLAQMDLDINLASAWLAGAFHFLLQGVTPGFQIRSTGNAKIELEPDFYVPTPWSAVILTLYEGTYRPGMCANPKCKKVQVFTGKKKHCSDACRQAARRARQNERGM